MRLSLIKTYTRSMAVQEAQPTALSPLANPVVRPLSSLKSGQYGLVVACRVEGADAPILRAMGLNEGAVLRVCRAGQPTIVALLCHRGCHCASSRVGLARALADRVMVTEEAAPVGESHEGEGEGAAHP